DLRASVGDAWEPYRVKLKRVRARLRLTLRWLEGELEGRRSPPGEAYVDYDDLAAPLLECYYSLQRCGAGIVAEGRLLDLLRRLACFRLTLLQLDIRQEASRHTATLDAITQALGLGSYAAWSEEERQAFLVRELENPRPLIPHGFQADESIQET